ncbi:extensin family protein [Roseovarius sp. M141]|uniref:extensin-like domain-containing protein n=1 Tax=Roseovarius sp. M141 TaxID=2583806 RepID=UPI0020CE33CE|nr:extensin family protein [Roseovarius sp. M141]MCQ0093945.1 extensin family protein [Roseovarius sp. M141]
MRRAAPLVALLVASGAVFADAPDTSLRPIVRPAILETEQPQPVAPARALYTPTRPVARPADLTQITVRSPAPVQAPAPARQTGEGAGQHRPRIQQPSARGGLMASLRPLLRPLGIGRKAQERKRKLARGAVCGDMAIQGEEVGHVPGRISGCGIDNAVKIRSIGGVALSQHALMDCQTARTIKAWMQQGMAPAVGGYGGGVAQLRVAAHYSCRTRNNRKGAKISEHGKGHAIDIAAFQLRDGRTISVLNDWGSGKKGRMLRKMHRSACGPFGTVLGPESDRFHRDHFHFDTARYRKGSYCR